mgnify:CR=1 FL=1
MPLKRIISRLDIKGPNLVKGINLEGLRVLGNPDFFFKNYYNTGADEIIYHDCVASLYDKKYLLDFINKASSNVFIPVSVGGGIKTLKDIELILKNGADKVFINSAAIKKPKFLDEAVKNFGSSTISISIEANKKNDGKYYCFHDYGRETSGKQVKNWIDEVQSKGVGEIILTSVMKEGTGEGFDIKLLDLVYDTIKVPLIIHGGAGNSKHISEVLKYENVSGVAISSILHYSFIQSDEFRFENKKEGNTSYLLSNNKYFSSRFEKTSIAQIKKKLKRTHSEIRT